VGEALNDAFIFTVGVAAAMVPEGLPEQIYQSGCGQVMICRKEQT